MTTSENNLRVIYLSGPPCTGKTSVLEGLERVGFKTIPEFYEPVPVFVREAFGGGIREKIRAQDWALEQHQLKQLDIKRLSRKGVDVAIDRSPFDVLVYSAYLGREVYLSSLKKLSKKEWISGESYLLSSPLDIMMDRFFARDGLGSSNNGAWQEFFSGLNSSYLNLFSTVEKYCPGLAERSIGTVGRSVEDVVSMITSLDRSKNSCNFNLVFQKLIGSSYE